MTIDWQEKRTFQRSHRHAVLQSACSLQELF